MIQAPSPLSKSEIRRGLRISSWEGAGGTVHNVLVTNAFLTGFALAWGANDFHLGLLGAIPFLAAPCQMVGAYLVDQWADRRREIVTFLGLFARGCWFPIAALPFLLRGSPQLAIPCILTLFLIYQMAYNASGPGWVAWMAVLVPERVRGRYLGTRNRVTEAVGVITALTAGVAIDHFRAAHLERAGFATLQFVSASMGIACFVLMRRQADPGHRTANPEISFQYLFRPLRDSRFRRLVTFNLAWCFGLNISSPFLNAHLINKMHWDFTSLALLGVIASVTAILMNPVWGRMADRFGYKPVLNLSSLGMLLVPLCYAFCPWGMRWPIYLANVLSGAALSGFILALFSLTLKNLPEQSRTMGAAILHTVAGPVTFLSGILSGWLAESHMDLHWNIGSLPFANYQILFLVSVFLRVPTLALLHRIHEPRAKGLREIVRSWVGG